jgi:hypothetical protein
MTTISATLDKSQDFIRMSHIWEASAREGVTLPDIARRYRNSLLFDPAAQIIGINFRSCHLFA